MYHELILALNGYTGDVFTYDGDVIQVCKALQIPLIHSSDLMILNDILEIATFYKKIKDYTEKVYQDLTLAPASGNVPSGIYVSSVCNGIREILDEYLETIANLELEILEDPYLTVMHIKVKLEPFRSLLRLLASLTTKIQAQIKSSAVMVEVVKTEYDMNISLQEHLVKLIRWINIPLYQQISSWVVFGCIFDPKDEFFIQGKSPEQNEFQSKTVPKSTIINKHCQKYYVDYSRVPSHFPVTLTERILFVGYAVGILGYSEKTKAAAVIKQKEFCDKMKKLPLNTFRLEELEHTLEELASAVGKDLHHLVVTETDLTKHLGIVKDFFLTGRGELFHDFLLNLKEIPFSKSAKPQDVRDAFILSANRVQLQEDVSKRLQVCISNEACSKNLAVCISCMSLEMEDEWPLHLLFTQSAMKKYNELFRFLLQVRRLQMDLNFLWVATRKIFRFPVPQGPAELRNVMSYFVYHLQHYLQEDVLESQFSILSDAIEKSDNFEQIRVAHATFQSNILGQSFRSSTQLRHFVEEIMKVCSNFVEFMNHHLQLAENDNIPVNEGITPEVMNFSNDFKRHMDLLLNLLKGMAFNPQSGQYLGQFLLRLDYNSYFSSVIKGFNI